MTSLILFSSIAATPILNTSALINQRLWQVEEWKNYVLENDFPIEARSTYVRFESRNLGQAPDAAVSIQPDYQKWYFEGGDKFLIKFMLTHPDYVLIAPIALPLFSKKSDISTTIWGGAARGILNNKNLNQDLVTKWKTLNIFWSNDRVLNYIIFSIFLAIIGISLVFSNKVSTYQMRFQNYLLFLILFMFEIGYLAWWFGSTPSDVGRHQFPFGVLLRIVFVFSLMYLIQILVDKFKSKLKH